MSCSCKKVRQRYAQSPAIMNFLRRLFLSLRARRLARLRVGYGAEVLFAGWVDLPKVQKEAKAHRISRK